MSPPASIDALELPRPSPPLPAAPDARSRQATSLAEPSQTHRWWFTFDGWRTADVDAEYVLA